MQGSILAKGQTPSFNSAKQREQFLKEFTFTNDKGNYVLEINYTFPTPSAAGNFCAGMSVNGWTIWKDINKQTLNEVYRKQLE